MRPYINLAILCVGLGCATTIQHFPLAWKLVDHPEENRIELIFRNDTGETLCLTDDDWPNSAGKLNQMGDVVFLIVSNERFAIQDFNTGYCPGGCEPQRVAPGEEIHGYIPYKEFNLPERLRYEPKSLEFDRNAYVCP